MLKSAIIAVATLGLAASFAVGSANAVETKPAAEQTTQSSLAVKKVQGQAKAKYFFKSAGKSDLTKLPLDGAYTGPKNAIIINGIN